MSILAKVFKCCRCQGEPPKPCTDCCDTKPQCNCCPGRDTDSGTEDEIENYSLGRYWRDEFQSFGDDIIEEFDVTMTQNGSSYLVDDCTVEVPVDMTYTYLYSVNGSPVNDYACSGTAAVRKDKIGLVYNGCQSWDLVCQQDPSVWLRSLNLTCSKGHYYEPPSAYSRDVPLGQLTPDTCEEMDQHTSKSNGNGIPVLATYDESANMLKRIFGCAPVSSTCECQS